MLSPLRGTLGALGVAAALFNPISLGPFIYAEAGVSAAYQDAAGTTPVTAAAQAVANWQNFGTGGTISQATAIRQPAAALVNGRLVPRFALNDYLGFASTSFGDFTALFVTNVTGDSCLFGAAANRQIRFGQGGAEKLSTFDGVNNPQSSVLAVARGTLSMVGVSRTANVVTFLQNAATYGTGTMTTGTTFDEIGATAAGASLPATGDICAVFVTNGFALTAAQVAQLYSFWQGRWPI